MSDMRLKKDVSTSRLGKLFPAPLTRLLSFFYGLFLGHLLNSKPGVLERGTLLCAMVSLSLYHFCYSRDNLPY